MHKTRLFSLDYSGCRVYMGMTGLNLFILSTKLPMRESTNHFAISRSFIFVVNTAVELLLAQKHLSSDEIDVGMRRGRHCLLKNPCPCHPPAFHPKACGHSNISTIKIGLDREKGVAIIPPSLNKQDVKSSELSETNQRRGSVSSNRFHNKIARKFTDLQSPMVH